MRRVLLPSIGRFLFLVLFLFLCLSPEGDRMLADGDTGWHVRAGESILSTGSVPEHDLFSYHVPPIPWTAHEWLSEVLMALVHRYLGLTGVVVLFALVASLTYALLYRFVRGFGGGNVLADLGIVLLVILSSQIHWLARPHLFSLLFTVLFLGILESHEITGSRRRLALLPLLMIPWVNLHGGFVTGPLLVGIYLAGNLIRTAGSSGDPESAQKAKLLGWVLAGTLVACLVNPRGPEILLFPFRTVSNRYLMDNVKEFLSPDFHQPMPFKYLLFLSIVLLAVSRPPAGATHLLLILTFLNMSLFSVRYILLYGIVAAPVLSRCAARILSDRSFPGREAFLRVSERVAAQDGASRGDLSVGIVLVLVALLVGTRAVEFRFDPRTKPVEAVNYLNARHVDGNMYNDDEFGDYLIYAAFPRYRVFFDGRSDMYGAERIREYQRIANFMPGWEDLIAAYRIEWFFIPTDSTLSRHLDSLPGSWTPLYADNVATIFVKATARTGNPGTLPDEPAKGGTP